MLIKQFSYLVSVTSLTACNYKNAKSQCKQKTSIFKPSSDQIKLSFKFCQNITSVNCF